MEGRTDPVAWTGMSGESKVFYTSLVLSLPISNARVYFSVTGAMK